MRWNPRVIYRVRALKSSFHLSLGYFPLTKMCVPFGGNLESNCPPSFFLLLFLGTCLKSWWRCSFPFFLASSLYVLLPYRYLCGFNSSSSCLFISFGLFLIPSAFKWKVMPLLDTTSRDGGVMGGRLSSVHLKAPNKTRKERRKVDSSLVKIDRMTCCCCYQ